MPSSCHVRCLRSCTIHATPSAAHRCPAPAACLQLYAGLCQTVTGATNIGAVLASFAAALSSALAFIPVSLAFAAGGGTGGTDTTAKAIMMVASAAVLAGLLGVARMRFPVLDLFFYYLTYMSITAGFVSYWVSPSATLFGHGLSQRLTLADCFAVGVLQASPGCVSGASTGQVAGPEHGPCLAPGCHAGSGVCASHSVAVPCSNRLLLVWRPCPQSKGVWATHSS